MQLNRDFTKLRDSYFMHVLRQLCMLANVVIHMVVAYDILQ